MQRVNLNEVKGFFNTENVYKVKDTYSYPCYGIGMPGIVFALPMYWNVNANGKLISPIRFTKNDGIRKTFVKKIEDREKIAEVGVIFGDFWKSKSKSFFRIKEADNSFNIMLEVHCKCIFDPDRTNILKFCKFYHLTRTDKDYCTEYFVFPISFFEITEENLKRIAINRRRRLMNNERKYYDKTN